VVSIIAILASMLMPALTKARDVARRTLCASNLRQMGLTALMYADDSNRSLMFPSSVHGWALGYAYASNALWTHRPGLASGSSATGLGLLFSANYLQDKRFFFCESNPRYQQWLDSWDSWWGNADGSTSSGASTVFRGASYGYRAGVVAGDGRNHRNGIPASRAHLNPYEAYEVGGFIADSNMDFARALNTQEAIDRCYDPNTPHGRMVNFARIDGSATTWKLPVNCWMIYGDYRYGGRSGPYDSGSQGRPYSGSGIGADEFWWAVDQEQDGGTLQWPALGYQY